MAFLAVFLFFSTAYYPLCRLAPSGLPYQWLVLAGGLAALGAAWMAWQRRDDALDPRASQKAAWLVLAQAPVLAVGLFFHRHISLAHGGLPSWGPVLACSALALGLWLWAALRPLTPAWVVGAGVGAALLMQVAGILGTGPSDFSDMTDAMMQACRSVLAGLSPYLPQPHMGGLLRTMYLPGLWSAYFPAALGGFDPRWIHLPCYAASAAALYAAAPAGRKAPAAALLLLFFGDPWLAFRHEVYISVLLVPLSLAVLAHARGRDAWAGAAWGWAAGANPIFWPLAPVMGAWVWRRRGPAAFARWAAASAGVFGLLLLPFVAWDAAAFWEAQVGQWRGGGGVDITHFNLYYWVPSRAILGLLQALGSAACALWAWRRAAEPAQPWLAATVCWAVFFTALFHTDHYFFFLPGALFMAALARPRSA